MNRIRPLFPIFLAIAVALPGVALRLFHIELAPPQATLVSGAAILAASFLLLWACDVAQMDIPQTLALAVVALIAVLPEYAVDMYFTWQAGKFPQSEYAHYAIANMTGANRLLVGVAWAVIVLIAWLKTRKGIQLDAERRTEIAFLGMATLYAFIIPLKGSLTWCDGVVFITMYVWYIRIASQRPCVECELEGPAACLGRLPCAQRRLATVCLFLFAAGVILADAEIFSEGLLSSGKLFGINEFLLVQWLAPIASEAPEFIVAIMFALRGQSSVALGSLLSAKLNQWTLLVGMIPAVYGVSAGTFSHPIPMNAIQMHELLLTAAQSLLAVALLVGLYLSLRGALLLFGLFWAQFLTPILINGVGLAATQSASSDHIHLGFSVVYMALAIFLFAASPRKAWQLARGLKA
jgi:cation:H+ antiporter